MNKIAWLFLIIIAAVTPFRQSSAAIVSEKKQPHTFEIGKGEFLMNGNPYTIKAAELHYPRIPKEYWDNRIKMSKALGMNTICIYVFWNVHETEPDNFDFSGNNDIREFVKLCQENGMNVIVRPGPYVCAEWEMGGLPWWLLQKEDISLRDNDPYFLERVQKFEEAVADQISDLTVANGGPILMVQVENEYGAYGTNKQYIANIRDLLKKLYPETILFQCDWSSNFTENGLDDLLWTMNFGTGADIDQQFEKLKSIRPESPLMCSEFWSGWFDKWGSNHETRPAEDMVKGIEEMLDKGISFSLYMTHGGSNFSHWAGANSPGYAPDVTSYDYDAPINENGHPAPKYFKLRDVLAKFEKDTLPDLPDLIEPIAIDKFYFSEVAPLFDNLPQPHYSENIKPMEFFNQGFGSILYTCSLPEIKKGSLLEIMEPHDYAQVFIDGKFIGKLDRRVSETSLPLHESKGGEQLEILIEATGRINFGRAIKDYKGITENVYIKNALEDNSNKIELRNWNVYCLPDDLSFYNNMNYVPVNSIEKNENGRYPGGVYRAIFNIEKPSDTFLNFENWGKGLVYVNGKGIGRIWDIGPQQTLYMPGVWLKEGENEILIFDIAGPGELFSEGLTEPVIDKLQNFETDNYDVVEFSLVGLSPAYKFNSSAENRWKEIFFPEVYNGNLFALEILNPAKPEDDNLSIAELYLFDQDNNLIPRENWKIHYISSEIKEPGNHTGDKIFDLQESTYWSSENNTALIVIDLGSLYNIKGVKYLSRMETNAPGAIGETNVYILNKE